MNAKLTAALLILAAVLANLAFTALGSIFNYPDVLDEPAARRARVLPRARGRGERLVHRAGAVRGADRADRDRRRPAVLDARRCGSPSGSGSPPRSCR